MELYLGGKDDQKDELGLFITGPKIKYDEYWSGSSVRYNP